jgi:hypothetical protein
LQRTLSQFNDLISPGEVRRKKSLVRRRRKMRRKRVPRKVPRKNEK